MRNYRIYILFLEIILLETQYFKILSFNFRLNLVNWKFFESDSLKFSRLRIGKFEQQEKHYVRTMETQSKMQECRLSRSMFAQGHVYRFSRNTPSYCTHIMQISAYIIIHCLLKHERQRVREDFLIPFRTLTVRSPRKIRFCPEIGRVINLD